MAKKRTRSNPEDASKNETHFACAERNSGKVLQRDVEQIGQSPVVQALLSASSGMLAVLNEHRQVVALNSRLLDQLGVEDPWDVLGLRHGEAVGCTHAQDNPTGGCGTGRMCSSCGAAIAIVTALSEDRTVERVCCIQTERQGVEGDLYLTVRAHPIVLEDTRWVLIFLQDNSAQQSWTLLQRVFFHDISNTVTVLLGNAYGLEDETPTKIKEQARILERHANRLAREVALQHLLLKAEAGESDLQRTPVEVEAVMAELGELCDHHPAAKGKLVHFDDHAAGRQLQTDPVVLNRVLANMVVNALEATVEGGQVRVWSEEQAGWVVFCVSNPDEMPVDIAGRIFQRNFSTKGGLGRGLGTYSMKLFGEKILGGEVDFSSPGAGQTVFSFRLPIAPD